MKITSLLIIVLFFFSCKKEGCTDSAASNAVDGVKENNETCVYEASIVFWHNTSTRSILNGAGASELTYLLDDTSLGSETIDNTFEAAPSCSEANAFHRDIAYDVESTKTLSYSVSDQNGTVHFNGSVTVQGKECVPVELHF